MKRKLLIKKEKRVYIRRKESLSSYESDIALQIISDKGVLIQCNENLKIESLIRNNLFAKKFIQELEEDKRLIKYLEEIQEQYRNTDYEIEVSIEDILIKKHFIGSESMKEIKYGIVTYNISKRRKLICSNWLIVENYENLVAEVNIKIDKELKWDRKKKVKCKEVPLVWIFSQEVAGYFFHECIGHILEEDIFRRTNYNVGDMFFGNRLNIYENWEKEISFDDFGKRTKERICLVKNGKIENILSGYNPMQDSSTGNAFTEEVYFPPRVRMNSMFVEAENMTGKIYENVKVAMYVEEVSGGECEPFSGEVGLCVKKAHIVINDKKVVALEPFSLLLNLRDLKKAEIKVGDNKKTMHSLCFKYGAIKKIKYTTPEILIDWRKSSEYITNRDF